MQVIIRANGKLQNMALAGVSSLERMEQALAGLTSSKSPFLWCGMEQVPDLDTTVEEILWIEGLFPFLNASILRDFLAFARTSRRAVCTANGSPLGLYYSEAGCASPDPTATDEGTVAFFHNEGMISALVPLGEAAHWPLVNKIAFAREAERVMADGVFLLNPEQTYIHRGVTVGAGTTVAHGVTLAGTTVIGANCRIDQGACITDATLGDGVHVKPYTVVEDAFLGEDVAVGPFANLRPGTHLGPDVKVGNFVEIKKVKMGKGSKASHLTYLGDALIGEDCNIGAGTITCNYDGYNKSLTTLGDRVFIGSDSQLVAPVTIGNDGYVAAGSTVTRNVPDNALAISRSSQVNKENRAETIREKARRKKAAATKTQAT